MVFRLDIEDDFEHTPFGDAYGSETINIGLGEDTTLRIAVLMSVALLRQEPGIYELVFGIEERNLDNPDEYTGRSYHFEDSKKYIKAAEDRARVLALVLAAMQNILDACEAKKIMMKTFHGVFPEKAMVKFARIREMMEQNGYETAQDFRHGTTGRHYWLYQKLD